MLARSVTRKIKLSLKFYTLFRGRLAGSPTIVSAAGVRANAVFVGEAKLVADGRSEAG
jgi:hypothetical protein